MVLLLYQTYFASQCWSICLIKKSFFIIFYCNSSQTLLIETWWKSPFLQSYFIGLIIQSFPTNRSICFTSHSSIEESSPWYTHCLPRDNNEYLTKVRIENSDVYFNRVRTDFGKKSVRLETVLQLAVISQLPLPEIPCSCSVDKVVPK